MADPFLSRDMLRRITGKVRGQAQLRQLRRQGIRFIATRAGEPILDADGFPLVPTDEITVADVYDIGREPRLDRIHK